MAGGRGSGERGGRGRGEGGRGREKSGAREGPPRWCKTVPAGSPALLAAPWPTGHAPTCRSGQGSAAPARPRPDALRSGGGVLGGDTPSPGLVGRRRARQWGRLFNVGHCVGVVWGTPSPPLRPDPLLPPRSSQGLPSPCLAPHHLPTLQACSRREGWQRGLADVLAGMQRCPPARSVPRQLLTSAPSSAGSTCAPPCVHCAPATSPHLLEQAGLRRGAGMGWTAPAALAAARGVGQQTLLSHTHTSSGLPGRPLSHTLAVVGPHQHARACCARPPPDLPWAEQGQGGMTPCAGHQPALALHGRLPRSAP